jgi:hypothetical protein
MKNIIFHSNQLGLRGTEVALFDYAFYNKKILGNESIITYNRNSINNNSGAIQRFQKFFKVIPYEKFSEVDNIICNMSIDLMYAIKSGGRDEAISQCVPTMVHAVFPVSPKHIHGASYAFLSNWLSRVCSNNLIPYVPPIIELPNEDADMRDFLGIKKSSIVFGCYGGSNSFDIQFVKKVVVDVVDIRDDIYFIFMNIDKFADHPRVIFLSGSSDAVIKVKFINTSDAMLHARMLGESFGLACGEFSIRNKPILTFAGSRDTNHIEILGKKAILYHNYQDLFLILTNFSPSEMKIQSWDCYSKLFNPSSVMNMFDNNLIGVASKNSLSLRFTVDFSIFDRIKIKVIKFKLNLITLINNFYKP